MTTNVTYTYQEFILSGSLCVRARPVWFEDYFNYEGNATLARLANRFGGGRCPQTSFFYGPTGSGKTTCARICGMISCCVTVAARLKANPEARALRPCGECRGCIAVMTSQGHEHDGYQEINASASDFEERFAAAMENRHYAKWTGSKLLPMVIAIDEAAGLREAQWKSLHKVVEDTQGVSFIFIMRGVEMGALTPPMRDRMQNREYEFLLPNEDQAVSGIVRLASRLGCNLELGAARLLRRVGGNSVRGLLDRLDETRDLWPDLSAAKIVERFAIRVEEDADE
jgi:DNA polymerase III gamma/tau subunit